MDVKHDLIIIIIIKLQSIVQIDISGYTLDAILEQINKDRKTQIIIFYSRKLITTEINYNIHNQELLIIIQTFQQ